MNPSRPLHQRILGRILYWVRLALNGLRKVFPGMDELLTRSLRPIGFALLPTPPAYFEDGLASLHDHGFCQDPRFELAYRRAIQASGGVDHQVRWRTHVVLWAARHAARLPGDFVECGVNTGFMSSALLTDLPWGELGKTLYLLDTFTGPLEQQLSEEERRDGRAVQIRQARAAGSYQTDLKAVRANFAEWPRVEIIAGAVPETLARVATEAVSLLHLDMNCAAPELAAAEHFWPLMTPGGLILLDDYAGSGFGALKAAFDEWAAQRKVSILALPTGQGLIVR